MVKQGYKPTEIGVIPEDWEVKKVSEISRITTGNKNTQDKIDNGIYPFFVRSQIVERINSFSFDEEAVLTAGDGVGVGKVFHYINGKFDYHQRVYAISHFDSNISGFYFFKYFQNNFYNRIMQMTAKSSVDSVRMETIADMQIPIPPLPEQEAIAEALSDADAWIESLEQLIAKKRLIKQGAMQELLTPKDDWEVKKLGEVLKLKGGFAFKSEDFGEFGIPIIRISDINGLTVELDNSVCVGIENISKDFIAEYGDILIAMSGATTGKIGKYCYENKAYINQRVGKFDINDSSKYSKDFLYHSLFTKKFKDQLNKFLAQGAQPNVSGSQIENIHLCFPKSLSEQERIATILSDMDAEIEALEQKLGKARQIKQGMMQELLTGRIRL